MGMIMTTIGKFKNMFTTSNGDIRASTKMTNLKTLWFNTGSKCNLSCKHCFMKSSPTNDLLAFIKKSDVEKFITNIKDLNIGTNSIGLTGGEPFVNPEIINIVQFILEQKFKLLILTNGSKLIHKYEKELSEIIQQYGNNLQLRISLDHYTPEIHDKERGINSFNTVLTSIKWLHQQGANITIAGRSLIIEDHQYAITQYKKLLQTIGINLQNNQLVIFPELRINKDTPEISVKCWNKVTTKPEDLMCSTQRMVVKTKDSNKTVIMPCTLLCYDRSFELGDTINEAIEHTVYLNHPFCAQFCVLGGASCTCTH